MTNEQRELNEFGYRLLGETAKLTRERDAACAYAVAQSQALERARGCIKGLLARTPVRDVAETLAEIDAALAKNPMSNGLLVKVESPVNEQRTAENPSKSQLKRLAVQRDEPLTEQCSHYWDNNPDKTWTCLKCGTHDAQGDKS
jgi:hypothetical protein